MTREEQAKLVQSVASKLRFTKVVATRSIKGPRGDNFIGFSAAFNTVQQDGEQGFHDDAAEDATNLGTMTLKEAQVAAIIVARQAELTAIDVARASSNLRQSEAEQYAQVVRNNFNMLLAQVLGDDKSNR